MKTKEAKERLLQLNVGCGAAPTKDKGWTNVDIIPGKDVDVVATCWDLPYEAQSVDSIFSSHMIEHLTKPELESFAIECYRVLKPNGSLHIVAPALDSFLEVYQENCKQESISVENFPISPLDWIDNALFARHLHDTDYHKQGIYDQKLRRVFNHFCLHQIVHQDSPNSKFEISMKCRKPSASNLLCSVVLASRNKASYLDLTLSSIFAQNVPFPFEVIVVDDGSTDKTVEVCQKYPVIYYHLDNPRYRNPSVARNVGYRAARGKVIIAQSDDIVHITPNTIEYLVSSLKEGQFLLASVDNYEYKEGKPSKFIMNYCSSKTKRPYFFLGALKRSDLYAIGGSDEEFVEPCFDDNWFADCLIHGRKLKPAYTDKAKGHHQSHPHGKETHLKEYLSKELYERKKTAAAQAGVYISSGGPWLLDDSFPLASPKRKTLKTLAVPSVVPSKLNLVKAAKPIINSQSEPEGKIPKTMNFFWAGSQLSWMRYLSLLSFRVFNPDWTIRVHQTNVEGVKQWNSSETLDSQTFHGIDYSEKLDKLDLVFDNWKPPIPGLSPAHASDLCQWELLSGEGGFYVDMDILFTKPVPYNQFKDQDAIFCLSEGFMAIGFFGASPNNPLFQEVSRSARGGYKNDAYQSTGAEAIYKLAGVWPNWGAINNPGEAALQVLKTIHNDLSVLKLPDHTVYPWNYKSTAAIFGETHKTLEETIGIHWFGGNSLSQEWNNQLTEENFRDHDNTFTHYAKLCYGE